MKQRSSAALLPVFYQPNEIMKRPELTPEEQAVAMTLASEATQFAQELQGMPVPAGIEKTLKKLDTLPLWAAMFYFSGIQQALSEASPLAVPYLGSRLLCKAVAEHIAAQPKPVDPLRN